MTNNSEKESKLYTGKFGECVCDIYECLLSDKRNVLSASWNMKLMSGSLVMRVLLW